MALAEQVTCRSAGIPLAPHAHAMERRRAVRVWTPWRAAGLLTVASLAAAVGYRWNPYLRPLVRHLTIQDVPPPTAQEALIRRQHEGLTALIARAEAGPLVPAGQHALVGVDAKLVESLLRALVPA